MKKICLEQKGHPPIWASLEEATFHTFPYWKHGEPFKLQKVGSARRVTHFVQSPSCNGRVSLLAGPTFLRGTLHVFHWTKSPVWNFGKTTCPVEGTFQLQRPNQSHREFGYRAWKQDTDHWSWEIKNLFMLSVRISSYGCTREVWRARKMRKSCTRR